MQLRGRISSWLDSESVRGYQLIVYTAYLAAGAQSLLLGQLPNTVAQTLGPWFNTGWLLLLIVCPVMTFTGMWLERTRVIGLWLQLGGDLGVACASLAYVAALVQTVYSGRATFAAFVVLALSLCAISLVARGVRKIRSVSKVVRRLDNDG